MSLDRLRLLLGQDPHLGTVMARLADAFGDRPLVEQPADDKTGVEAVELTYAQAAAEIDRLAASIANGSSPGDRVVIAVPNGYRFLLLTLAAARAGCVAVPVNPQNRASEVDHIISDSEATLVIRDNGDLPPRRGLPPVPTAQPGDVAALLYTSGTTGKPKGVRLTHRALVGGARGIGIPRVLRQDEAVLALPAAHVYGFLAYLGLAAAGIPAYALPRFNPVAVLDAIESRRSSIFLGVPAMYRMLLDGGAEKRDLHSVRVWASGADALPVEIARTFQKLGASAELPLVGAVGEALFVEGYGMAELGGGVAVKIHPPLLAGLVDLGVGVPLPGWELRVDAPVGEVGELLVKGPGTMQGYHGAPDATAEVIDDDGWVHTGDLARKGPLGTVAFAGRAKDVIKNGGYSVYALEVERAIEEHPAVAEAAVVGLPDDRAGERVAAAVRLRDGQATSEQDLLGYLQEHLSDYKVPKQILFVHDLPRTGSDKVQKAQVRELF
jgi:long-chain acyl-CoA synthetase